MSIEIALISFQIVILVMSVVIHEVSHGAMALYLGDITAKQAGRLTLNPINHLDIWGSFFVPIFMIFTFGFGFGWAKPVPYNPYNLRNQKNGPAWVALAGPLSNIGVAIVAGLIARILPLSSVVKMEIAGQIFNFKNLAVLLSGSYLAISFWLLMMILAINIFLAVFNLIPIPPLDGSKLLFALAPISEQKKMALEQFGFIFLLIFIFFFSTQLGYLLSLVLSIFFKTVVGL